MHLHLIRWTLDFIGVHNGENTFSTRMYNFWSGFGGNISVLALIGTVFGVYRHNLSRLKRFENLRHLDTINPLHYTHKKDKTE